MASGAPRDMYAVILSLLRIFFCNREYDSFMNARNIQATLPPISSAPSLGVLTAVDAVERLLARAAELKASDIHCDPRAHDIRVRLRIDGIMEDGGVLPKRLHEELIARLKILAGARTDLHSVPQDGRWRADIGTCPFNVRASFMPTYYGENAVLRLLPMRDSGAVPLTELGFSASHVEAIHSALASTSGLLLVSGPTGSGKTTTLHSCLAHKAAEQLSVITLEDPVEYEIAGVRQVHIRHSHGVSFASGLRASLRQDPDVIMVGEIRDGETARTAIHMALTGHLVMSTLHTVSAIECIPRLLDMGIDRYLVASTLRLAVGQRLVRSVCRACSGSGCDTCRRSGYAGRMVLAETLPVDQILRDMIFRGDPAHACLAHVRSAGFVTLEEDGEGKVAQGLTSRAEVLRVLHA